MRRTLKSAIALLAVSALPLVAVAPAAAATNPDLSSITFDCNTSYDDYWDLPFYTATVTVTLVNCETFNLYDINNTGDVTYNGGTVLDSNGTLEVDSSTEVITISSATYFEAWDNDGEASGDAFEKDFMLNFEEPYEMPDPSGSQLADSSQPFAAANTLETTYGTAAEIELGDEIGIGGDTDHCGILPGQHIYATQDITVSTTGEYTFRVTGVESTSSYLIPTGDFQPLSDPMVALYSKFDPADPNTGNVGCNDDLNDLEFGGHNYDDNDFNLTQQGDYVEGHFSYFVSNLEPGEYTLVFTTWDDISASEWEAGDNNGDTWTAGAGKVYFDIWGPTDGLTLGHELGKTGVDTSLGLWAGLGLLGTGAAIAVARRRSVRA